MEEQKDTTGQGELKSSPASSLPTLGTLKIKKKKKKKTINSVTIDVGVPGLPLGNLKTEPPLKLPTPKMGQSK